MFQHPRSGFTLVEIGVVVILLLASALLLVVPRLRRERAERNIRSCQEYAVKIDNAKEQWALEFNKAPGATVLEEDIVRPGHQGYLDAMPLCPSGATYKVNPIADDPTCTSGLAKHGIPTPTGCITLLE
ncbi:hypothetical protein HYR69_03170 [Candidatus Sumerlaeota bacterium]|nr:hypothetical protein [Candidatus Sumerlaeota bacterium]MBI3736196.1 hypothetical protein [Candidatus Sumerlaeota bacterium]